MGVFSIARKFSSSSKPATLLRNISARFCISRCNAESLELHRLLDRVLNHFCRLGCVSARVRNLDISSTFPPRKRQKERKEPKLDKVPVVYRSEQTKLKQNVTNQNNPDLAAIDELLNSGALNPPVESVAKPRVLIRQTATLLRSRSRKDEHGILLPRDLSDHFKSGQRLSLQNRPTGLACLLYTSRCV